MRALAINLAEATVLTTGTYPQKAVRLHELNDRLQTKIELMQIGPSGRTLDHCSFNAGGKTYNAVPWRQNKKNRPNWTIEIQHRATEERPP